MSLEQERKREESWRQEQQRIKQAVLYCEQLASLIRYGRAQGFSEIIRTDIKDTLKTIEEEY